MTQLSRRQIIKTLFLGTAFSNLIGQARTSPLLVALQSSPTNQNGFMRLNLADFPELAEARGSVRISTSALDPRTNRQVGLFAPVIINRGDAGQFYVLSAACTHQDCVVRRLNATTNRMICPCHGSAFRPDGTVALGPAMQPLQEFEFRLEGELLTIDIPDVFFEMSVEKTESSSRLRISFLAFEGLFYEVFFRETLTAPFEPVLFSTTPDGPLDQTEIQVPGDFANVYVERPGRFGFFEIAMKTRKL
jgi:Rieske Fe-S protein